MKLVEYILQDDKVIPLGEATETFAKWWTNKYYDSEEDMDITLEFPKISEREAKDAIKQLRTGKSLSTDLIADEIFEEGGRGHNRKINKVSGRRSVLRIRDNREINALVKKQN